MSLILHELGIVIAMQQPNPNLVTIEFLKLSGIIPADWQLAKEPINTDRISQLLFTNGVTIVAEPNRIMFGENIGERDINTLVVTSLARKYTEIFKLAKYSAIGINIRSYSPQASSQNATQYINHQLLADGSWQNYGTAPVRAALNLVYSLPGRELNLEIAAMGMQFAQAEIMPVILFSGNFNYNLSSSNKDGLVAASQILANWQTDLSAYCELITDRFISSPNVIEISTDSQNGDGNLEAMKIPYAPNLPPITTIS